MGDEVNVSLSVAERSKASLECTVGYKVTVSLSVADTVGGQEKQQDHGKMPFGLHPSLSR